MSNYELSKMSEAFVGRDAFHNGQGDGMVIDDVLRNTGEEGGMICYVTKKWNAD